MDKLTLLLKLLALTSNVLNEWGVYIPCPFGVKVSGKVKQLEKELCNFNCKTYSSSDKAEDILKELTVPSVDPVIFTYDGSFKAETRLGKIVSSVKVGQYNGKDVIRLPIILIVDGLSDNILDDVVFIEINDFKKSSINIWDILPQAEDLPLILNKINSFDDGLSDKEKYIQAAICFVYPFSSSEQESNLYEELKKVCQMVIELDNQAKDSFGISAQFIETLYKYKIEGKPAKLFILPNINDVIPEKSEKIFFHDFIRLYISNYQFNCIANTLKHIVGVNRLKEILYQDQILVKGNSKGYTSKMPYYNQYGIYKRADMICLDLNKLNKTGEVTFIDNYGGNEYED